MSTVNCLSFRTFIHTVTVHSVHSNTLRDAQRLQVSQNCKNAHPVSIFSKVSFRKRKFPLQKADPVKEKVHFCYYRLTKGICGILLFAKEGIRLWFRRFKTPDGAYLSAASRVASNLNDSKIWQSISSMIFWGPPGVGKTTLARIIANHTRSGFVNFSAVTSGIREKKRTGRSGWKRAAASGDSYCCSLRYSSTRFVRFFITVSSPTEPAK